MDSLRAVHFCCTIEKVKNFHIESMYRNLKRMGTEDETKEKVP